MMKRVYKPAIDSTVESIIITVKTSPSKSRTLQAHSTFSPHFHIPLKIYNTFAIKMKTTFAILSALFAASTTLAAPAGGHQTPPSYAPSTSQTATVSFINDQTGANAPIVAPLDGTVISISGALISTPLGASGTVLASSAQFIQFPQGAACAITAADGQIITNLNDQKTFADLDGNPDAAVPVNLTGATLICEI
jgi:hypothetical protein